MFEIQHKINVPEAEEAKGRVQEEVREVMHGGDWEKPCSS